MVEETLEERILSLIKKHYGTPIIGRYPEITLDSDIDTDLSIDWPEAEELMDEFFEEFSVDKAGFNIETYYPNPPMRTLLKNMFRREKDIPTVPEFTVLMLLNSAKAGRWLY
ncbi:MAG: DUF1493 family protein [Serratia proteamaculans]|uniref:DUF1493 family protein n=1 Tax=Serratia TaxID=613 RepID=UPI000BFF8444|nr:DUF1493 family protein [Serratia sp. BW106]